MSQFSQYYVFNTQAAANLAQAVVYALMVRLRQRVKVALGGLPQLLDLSTQQMVDVTTLPLAQLTPARFPFYGRKAIGDPFNEFTDLPILKWAIPRQIPFGALAGKWILPVPNIPELQTGDNAVTDDPTWWEAVPSPIDPNA